MTKTLLLSGLTIQFATALELFIDPHSSLIPIGILISVLLCIGAAISDIYGADIRRALQRRRIRKSGTSRVSSGAVSKRI